MTESHIAWQGRRRSARPSSLLATASASTWLVFGRLHAFEAKSGKYLWEHDFDTEVQASPCLINGQLWLLTSDGETIIGDAGPDGFKPAARHPLGEPCGASHTFGPGRIYIRSRKHLFCIGNKNG